MVSLKKSVYVAQSLTGRNDMELVKTQSSTLSQVELEGSQEDKTKSFSDRSQRWHLSQRCYITAYSVELFKIRSSVYMARKKN